MAAGAQTEGPWWVEENLNRADIRVNPLDGSIRPGALWDPSLTVQNGDGSAYSAPAGARAGPWHCDAGGIYSNEAANDSMGRKFLTIA